MSTKGIRPEDKFLVRYAEPGKESEFLAARDAWEAGEIGEDELPPGAVFFDSRGRKKIFGIRIPKRADEETGIKRMPRDFDGRPTPNWKRTLDKPIPAIQCTGTNSRGERCGRWAIRGAEVCISHGGNLPNVREAADAVVQEVRMRIAGLTPEAAEVLEELTRPGTADAIRLKAATEILDRAGIKGQLDINVQVEHKIDPGKTIAERLEQISTRAVEATVLEIGNNEVVDAEIEEGENDH